MAVGLPPGVARLRIVIEEPRVYRAEVTMRDLSTCYARGASMQEAEDNALFFGEELPANLRLSRDKSCERTQDRVPQQPTSWLD